MRIPKPASGPVTTAEKALITAPVLLSSLLHSLALTTAYIALPNMKGNLAATPDQAGWIITSFLVANAIAVAATGWFSVRFGRKLVFLTAVGGFTLTSMLCATATTLEELVVFRVFQGLLSGPLLPLSQAIMLDTYPRRQHAFAMSIWSVGMIMGPIAGPALGAWLTEEFSWRAIFYINIPFGALGLLGCLMTVPETERRRERLDWLGFLSLSIAVGSFQLMLDRGERLDWFDSLEIQITAGLAAMAAWIFFAHSATARRPFLNLAVFRDHNFCVGVALIFLFGLNVFSALLLVPLFLQDVQGYSVVAAGAIIATRGVGTAAGMLLTGRLLTRLSPKPLIVASLLMIALPAGYMTGWTDEATLNSVILVNVVSGLGIGIIWVCLTTMTFSTLPTAMRTEGAALFALLRVIGASIGISVFVSTLTRNTQINYSVLAEQITRFNEQLLALGDGLWDIETLGGAARVQNLVFDQALMIAYLNDFKLLMITSLIGVPLGLLFRRVRRDADDES